MQNEQTQTPKGNDDRKNELPVRDRMLRRESVERKRASTDDILGGRRLDPNNQPDYRHD
jgi:hypothetical protein